MNASLFGRREEGQALIVVALCFAVLMGGLSLAADWGHGLAMRRASQNEADAAALAAGKALASTYTGVDFRTSKDDAWTFAACAFRSNRSFAAPSDAQETLAISYAPAPIDEALAAWDSRDVSGAICPASVKGLGDRVATDTKLVYVRVTTTYRTLLGAATRQDLSAGAIAAVRLARGATTHDVTLPTGTGGVPGSALVGTGTSPDPIWPLVRYFRASTYRTAPLGQEGEEGDSNNDFNQGPCGLLCDPNAARSARITFWSSGGLPSGRDRRVFDSFVGLVDPSHMSIRRGSVHQLTTMSDYRGSAHQPFPTVPLANASPRCPSASWDTNGSGNVSDSATCNIANWFYRGFGGALSLDTDWNHSSWDPYRGTYRGDRTTTLPNAIPLSRRACDEARSQTPYFAVPSCTTPNLGDWVETYVAPLSASDNANLTAMMRSYIQRNGRETQWSNTRVSGGANSGNLYGKAAVVYIYLFDCADTFDAGTGNWRLINAAGDCSRITSTSTPTIDRVHLFTLAPFTFYEGLVTTGAVEAYWGGAFGDQGACQPDGTACQPLSPLKNSAFLVTGQ
jgi:Flp pilus assembly protein TadG